MLGLVLPLAIHKRRPHLFEGIGLGTDCFPPLRVKGFCLLDH
jgi:hypothetical protein